MRRSLNSRGYSYKLTEIFESGRVWVVLGFNSSRNLFIHLGMLRKVKHTSVNDYAGRAFKGCRTDSSASRLVDDTNAILNLTLR